MNTATETLLAFWKEPRNIPFKNSLISKEPPKDGEEPTTCMCAQGQALHMIGGYTEEDLRTTEQSKADREVARLLGISVAHSVLLRLINDGEPGAPSDVLTNPEKYLGVNYQAVMKFWWFMDGLAENQWNVVARRYDALDDAAWNAARIAARSVAGYAARIAARSVAGYAAWSAAWSAAGDAAWSAAWSAAGDAAWSAAGDAAAWSAAGDAARIATYELILGIENPVFLPMFEGFVAG
jgi:hypothetical protein